MAGTRWGRQVVRQGSLKRQPGVARLITLDFLPMQCQHLRGSLRASMFVRRALPPKDEGQASFRWTASCASGAESCIKACPYEGDAHADQRAPSTTSASWWAKLRCPAA